MTKSEKIGVVVGVIGASVGSLSWIVIAGASMGAWPFIVLPLLFGVVCVVSTIRLYTLYPQSKFTIMGLAILWLSILNLIFGNLIYDRLPENILDVPTGKESFSLLKLNLFIGLISLLGFCLVLVDVFRGKKSI
ncbi:hypothetical protein HRbin37_01642 [bacterium HR37]|nr:hypothetical protein HRbin37_01642 [bacterium HR37]